jgi:hypothetical protein
VRQIVAFVERERSSPMSRWPRILFLSTAVVSLAYLVGIGLYEVTHGLETIDRNSIVVQLAIMVAPGLFWALLARPGTTDQRVKLGLWATLVTYVASTALMMLVVLSTITNPAPSAESNNQDSPLEWIFIWFAVASIYTLAVLMPVAKTRH